MRIPLGTQVVLWALADSPRLSARARSLPADAGIDCWVSSANGWEVAIKAALGGMGEDLTIDRLEEGIASAGLRTLAVTIRQATAIGKVDVPHADPLARLPTADEVPARPPVAIGC